MSEQKPKLGDKVRVKENAPRHAGKIGYVDSIGEGPSSGTVILCTENRYNKPDLSNFRNSSAILFAAYSGDIEIIQSNQSN